MQYRKRTNRKTKGRETDAGDEEAGEDAEGGGDGQAGLAQDGHLRQPLPAPPHLLRFLEGIDLLMRINLVESLLF